MRILLDECMPDAFGQALGSHEVSTTRGAGFSGVRNGALLGKAQHAFDAFVTLDKGIVYQHPAGRFALRIVCIRPYSSRLQGVLPYTGAVLTALEEMSEGEVRLLDRLPKGR